MADNSLYNLSDKRYVSLASTNHKEDIIKERLNELKIAYIIMKRHPKVLEEYVNAIKSGAQNC
jgi:hypothetical protein